LKDAKKDVFENESQEKQPISFNNRQQVNSTKPAPWKLKKSQNEHSNAWNTKAAP